jgi:hypothetical protein
VKQLSKEYIEKNEEFIRLDVDEEDEDEEEGDLTGLFIENLLSETQPKIEECQKLRDLIDQNYKELLKYLGEDLKKLDIEEFFKIMIGFKKSLEVIKFYN